MNHLRELRKKRKLTIDQLAELSGRSKSYISDVENQKLVPNVYKAYGLAESLKVSVFKVFPKQNKTGECVDD